MNKEDSTQHPLEADLMRCRPELAEERARVRAHLLKPLKPTSARCKPCPRRC